MPTIVGQANSHSNAPRRGLLADAPPAELRSRLLLALALVNHRRTPDGLSSRDVDAVHAALLGGWDTA